MKRKLLLLFLMLFVGIYSLQAQCQHSVELVDSYGDGWNGGTLTVSVNGTAVLTDITLTSGSGPAIFYFAASTGDDIDADYTPNGYFAYENEYTVKDGGGSIIGQSGQDDEEPEDILNMVGNCPSCPPPSGQTETGITTTSAQLSWTSGGASTWDIEWGTVGFTQGEGTPITATSDNPYTLLGLTASETYDWYVRDDCGAEQSAWVGPSTFATACADISIFPYTEDFESDWLGSPAAPQCWTVVDNNSDGDKWVQNSSATYAHSGTKSAQIYTDFNSANDDWLITPAFDLSGAANYRLKFWTRARSSGEPEELQVLLSTTNRDIASFTEVVMASTPINFTTYTEYILDLSAYNSTVYIAFVRNQSPADGYYLYLDDVTVEEILAVAPNPATVSFPTDGLTTFNNPLLSWTASATGEPATGFKVYLDETDSPTTEVYDGANTSFQTSGLTAGTQYYWQVVPYNATGDAVGAAVWSFSTVADGYLAESFENASFPPAGWANPGNWSRSTSQYFAGSASAYKFSSTTPTLLRTPVVTLTGSSTLDFFAKTASSTTSQRIQVKYSADGSDWTDVGDEISLPSAGPWALYSVDLSSLDGNNYYLAIANYYDVSSGSVYVDHVIGPMITPLIPDAVTMG